MSVFSKTDFRDHEQVVFLSEEASGLHGIIAVHNTNLGPALGGCRMWPYQNEDEAIRDVLRLSRGMTYKSALAGLPYGGGKSVIIADPHKDKTPALFEAMGRAVERLGGRYIIAEDMGTSVEDMAHVGTQTDYVRGVSNGSGDPSPMTALGVAMGIRASVQHKFGTDLKGVRVSVQGLGHVGYYLCKHLYEDGAQLVVTDINQANVDRVVNDFKATAVDPDTIYDADVDVYAPCAMGAVINDDTLPRLKAKVVAGAANNQLARGHHGQALKDAGILYAPDYCINAGGVINIHYETPRGYDRDAAVAHISRIKDTLIEIYKRAEQDRIPTNEAAGRLAEDRFLKKGDSHPNVA